MASTAAGVAVGSTIGHTLGAGISSLFGGGGQQQVEQAPPPQQSAVDSGALNGAGLSNYNSESSDSGFRQSSSCEVDARNFTRCLDENNGNMQICDWYLQQLKVCQQASSASSGSQY